MELQDPLPWLLLFAWTMGAQVFAADRQVVSYKEYVRQSAVPKHVIDRWLQGPSWTQFDPETGYILSNSLISMGMNGSGTIETVQSNGARTAFAYADRKPRINTYGDSFTECMQVSDSETWQEYLAGHLGEPVANFGVGGYGVYQAYRRMVREESTERGAPYIVLVICCDDPVRSLMRSRRVSYYRSWSNDDGKMFHNNFWANVELELGTGKFLEKENLLPTRESLYRMSDPAWMVANLRDDLALQLSAFSNGYTDELDRRSVQKLSSLLDFKVDWKNESTLQKQAGHLLSHYGQQATIFILDKARSFAAQRSKRLLVVLHGSTDLEALHGQRPRQDQEILDHLRNEKFEYFDLNAAFIKDYIDAKTTLPVADYMKRYFVDGVGHVNPKGNHLVAYALKDKMIEWLSPKPVPYQTSEEKSVSFKGYLRGGVYEH